MSFHSASDRVLRQNRARSCGSTIPPTLADNAHAEFDVACQMRDFGTTADRGRSTDGGPGIREK
jgi:hypothetical protein